jgi:ABC-type polysaccharide/polyol phosphate transport system ATPase subunit
MLVGRRKGAGLQALAGVDLDIRQAEMIGIVGGNGSGKTTLLQLIAGITTPTGGTLDVNGRVLPLLALGAGFHPELTGAENIELFGTILGVRRKEARAAAADIAEFGGVTRHINTPLKRYSDGMGARLSFAVAMGFPADIYLFDEVLSVVDQEFRERCIEAIHDLRRQGRTVVFVSHQAEQIRAMCDRVAWLEQGRVRQVGSTDVVMNRYLSHDHSLA